MVLMNPLRGGLVLAVTAMLGQGFGQVIEFESAGLRYQTLTRNGVTIMYARLPAHVREYSVLQVAVSNGSGKPWTIRPEDFVFHRDDGSSLITTPARNVVRELMDKAGRNDVIKLVSTYESGLYGMSRIRSTNGYEQRRQAALAEVNSTKLKAAAAASAIAFVQIKLTAGESTDGAVFFDTNAKPLGAGKLIVRASGVVFEFNPE